MHSDQIISRLPYSSPFLFVDAISEVNENSITGSYYFSPELDFYKGHFKTEPVTPGVILTECMAQIGLVCFGIYLLNSENSEQDQPKIAMTSSDVEYLLPVPPGEEVRVVSEKIYYRFNKLKCRVKMFNAEEKLVCRGELAGMILASKSGSNE
ncbi:hydroxymyristoyl-ACP dehydratase [Gramella sp. BOM4]|nr:hydroxymyristoyl-ACP dehydratase [Christiangramia bathymodioli]